MSVVQTQAFGARHDTSTKELVNYARYFLAGWCAKPAEARFFVFLNAVIFVQIEQGSARPLVKTFDVKKRQYFGNTSMEAEISLLMANQTLVRPHILLRPPSLCHLVMSSVQRRTPHGTPGLARKIDL
jgi:hypothetical protein